MPPNLDSPHPLARASTLVPPRKRASSKTYLPASDKRRDKVRADKVIRFIENLTVPSGYGAGGKFKLRPWQKKFVRDIYEPTGTDGLRLVNRAILSIARKNGKTAIIAALVLVHLIGPEAIPNGEIFSAANDRKQAAQVFKTAKQMILADPELRARVTIVESTKRMVGRRQGTFYEAMSAEAGTKHGLNPSFVVFDELAQARNRTLYDVLDTSMGAQKEPLFVVISTQSNDPEHILSKLIDDGLHSGDPRIVCHLYAAPEDTPDEALFDEATWKLANPALGDFRSLKDFRALADKVKRSPAEEPKFRNLYLNQRVSPTASLLARAEWVACAGPAELVAGEEVYLALDLSSTNDLTALVAISADERSRVNAFFWKPEDLLQDHSSRDFGSGHKQYDTWHKAGLLDVTPGRTIDPQAVALKVAELTQRYRVVALAYDRWRIDEFLRELDRIGLQAYRDDQQGSQQGSGLRLVPWGQGFKDMAPAIDALELAVAEQKLEHPNNPVLTWNIANAVATMDPAGNRKIDKNKARFRIDGAVALAMGMGLKMRDRKAKPASLEAVLASIMTVPV
jgi:phage terminase large subunit-like protein